MARNLGLPAQSAEQDGRHLQKVYKLRALRAPMYNAKTGKHWGEVCLTPGRIYTFGRSRTCCDVVFLDRRVSRRHCQLYLDPVAEHIFLLEGAAAKENLGIEWQDLSPLLDPTGLNNSFGEDTFGTTTARSHLESLQKHAFLEQSAQVLTIAKRVRKYGPNVENEGAAPPVKDDDAAVSAASCELKRNSQLVIRKEGIKKKKVVETASGEHNKYDKLVLRKDHIRTKVSETLEEKPQSGDQAPLIANEQHASQRGYHPENRGGVRNYPLCPRLSWAMEKKRSLNGLYVDGQKLGHGGHRILNPGSEVSFIVCTMEGKPVDPGFGEAVGFVVEVECCPRNSFAAYCTAGVDTVKSCKRSCSEFESSRPSAACSRRRRPLIDISGPQCPDDRSDFSVVEGKSCREGTHLQSCPFTNPSPPDWQETGRLITGATCTKRSRDGHGNRLPDSVGAKGSFKRTLNLPRSKLNQGGREQTTTKKVDGEEIVFGSRSSGEIRVRKEVSSTSCDLTVEEIANIANYSKTTSILSKRQLKDATCRFLTASDCARKPRIGRVDTRSIGQFTLTNAIQATVGHSLAEGVQELQNQIRIEHEDLASGVCLSGSDGASNCRLGPMKPGSELFPRHMIVEDSEAAAASTSSPSAAVNSNEDDGTEALMTDRSPNALVSCKLGTREAMGEKRVLAPPHGQSYFPNAAMYRIPKRSTTEILGLLRRVASISSVVTSSAEGDKILQGFEEEQKGMEVSKMFSPNFTSTDDPMLEGNLLGCGVLDGELVTTEINPVTLLTNIELSMRTDTDDGNKSEDARVKTRGGSKSPSKGRATDQTLSGREVKDLDIQNLGNNIQPLLKCVPHEEDERVNERHGDSGFLLNRLDGVELPASVSLQDLLTPTDDLLALFVATFTSDILWFLTSQNLSPDLPVTIACHDHDRCWSTSEASRSSSPFPTWPNVTVVFPPFPDSCCFATEKRQGIGCHHPKIFLLPRQKCLRVIVTSANLTRKQWHNVTNSVWWQDFPCKNSCDYEALFCTSGNGGAGLNSNEPGSDFALHLSSFVASLVADVPSEAHWALDLAKYNFSGATASLVTSIPGLHGCPCPPVPRSVLDVVNYDTVGAKCGVQRGRQFLAAVMSNVVGVSHRFKDSADPCGKRVQALAALLNDTNLHEDGMMTVQLERTTNVTADPNAVSVIVSAEAPCISAGMVTGKDSLQMHGEWLSSPSSRYVQLGFLPRNVAKWVAPLYDSGLCTFAARIWPHEVLGVASGVSKKVVQLVIYIFAGLSFSGLSADPPTHHKVALSCLLRSMDRPLGLWRLHQVLSIYNWLDSAETSFVFGSSSVGTSLDAAFLAAFSAASGKRLAVSDLTDESDPEWGAWTAENEVKSPSIGLVFPTIKTIRAAKGGPCTHQGILCFAESTWERLKSAHLLHDAVPFPVEREGIPMHVKVAQRRFQNKPGDVPYGWIYCGSHNFSPAAWGRPLAKRLHPCRCSKTALKCTLFISNYEVGLVFVEPPPSDCPRKLKFKPLSVNPDVELDIKRSDPKNQRLGLDKFVLPFRVPAPKYDDVDLPATGRALHSVIVDWRNELLLKENGLVEDGETEVASTEEDNSADELQHYLDSDDADFELSVDMQMEEKYGDTLWSQIDSIMLQ